MERLQHGTEPEIRRVTQEEASRMVELWTHAADRPCPGLIDLRDVAEALGIPDAEAGRLLDQVRQPSPAVLKPPLGLGPVLLRVLLGLSLAFSTLVSASALLALNAGKSFGPFQWSLALGAFAWTLGWPLYALLSKGAGPHQAPAPAQTSPLRPFEVMGRFLLALSFLWAFVATYLTIGDDLNRHHAELPDVLIVLGSALWVAYWLYRYHRPLARTLTHAARRLAQPHR